MFKCNNNYKFCIVPISDDHKKQSVENINFPTQPKHKLFINVAVALHYVKHKQISKQPPPLDFISAIPRGFLPWVPLVQKHSLSPPPSISSSL